MAASEEDNETLETLLNKATNPLNREDDWEYILNFCDRVNFELEGPQVACRLIGHKIQSPQEREALQALTVAEACVKNCGESFHREVGKFRFLNEMIKLISPKYLGGKTSEKMKKKTIVMLYSWQMGLPHETKIKEAYDMLKKQGLIKEDPAYVDQNYQAAIEAKPKMATFEDEDKAKLLSRLLSSKHVEDLQAANRLIKNMVKEEEKKSEKLSKRINDLESCNNNVKLLTDMLLHYDPRVTSGEKDLMRELYQACEKMRPNLFKLASDTEDQDDGIADILKTNDLLMKVMEEYRQHFGDPNQGTSTSPSTLGAKSSLIDIGNSPKKESMPVSRNVQSAASSVAGVGSSHPVIGSTNGEHPPGQSAAASALSGDLSLLDLNTSSSSVPVVQSRASVMKPTSASDLETLLGPSPVPESIALDQQAKVSNVQALNAVQPRNPFSQGAPQQVNTFNQPHMNYSYPMGAPQMGASPQMAPNTAMYGMPQQRLQTPMSGAPMGVQPGINQYAMTQPNPAMMGTTSSSGGVARQPTPKSTSKPEGQDSFADLANLGKSFVTQPKATLSNPQVGASSSLLASGTPVSQPAVNNTFSPTLSQQPVIPAAATKTATPTVLSLADIFVSLETVLPGETPPLTAYEKNNVKTVLHFAKNSPRPDVTVIVVSTMSTNSSPVKELSFQAAAPKIMRVKLQPASATDLPAFNPILPPAAITQVMLLANPQKEKVRLKFKIQYTIGDQVHSDIGEVDKFSV